MSQQHRDRFIQAAERQEPLFIESLIGDGQANVRACCCGRVLGVSASAVTIASGERVIVIALASVQRITSLPNVVAVDLETLR